MSFLSVGIPHRLLLQVLTNVFSPVLRECGPAALEALLHSSAFVEDRNLSDVKLGRQFLTLT